MLDRREFLADVALGIGTIMLGKIPLPAAEPAPSDPLPMRFITTLIKADAVNGNKRIYPRKVLEECVRKYKELPPRTLVGEIGATHDSIIHFANASHVITDLRMEGFNNEYLVADIEVIDTPMGRVLKRMLNEYPTHIVFRTRGVGNGCVNEDGILVIKDNYKLITVDAVPAEKAAVIEKGPVGDFQLKVFEQIFKTGVRHDGK